MFRENTAIKEIPIEDMKEIRIGNAQNEEAGTGVTVILFDKPATIGADISGGGPASRETPLASPITADNPANAIVLSGGSAYGLAAADGVMQYLEERGIGYETGFAKVPLVLQSCIYDLGYRRPDIRPDREMGYAACVDAEHPHPVCGSVGGGTGATVGKIGGPGRDTKSGLGFCAVSVGALRMAAVVVVNALGDVFDPSTGRQVAGLHTPDGKSFMSTCEVLYRMAENPGLTNTNTTIGAVITNGRFNKAEMNKIASMARCAYARCINPVGTMGDGDTIYAAATGDVPSDVNLVGVLAAEVMQEAILRAVR